MGDLTSLPLPAATTALPPPKTGAEPINVGKGGAGPDIGIQARYCLTVIDETGLDVGKDELGIDGYLALALPPQSVRIQRSLRAEVAMDVASGITVTAGSEGLGRISLSGTHGVGKSRDFSMPSDGLRRREALVAFFDAWVKANDRRARTAKELLRIRFDIVDGKWSNPINESYVVWPDAYPTDSRGVSRPHAWDWDLELTILATMRTVPLPDPLKVANPAATAKKLGWLADKLEKLGKLWKTAKAKLQKLRDLVGKLRTIAAKVKEFVDGVKDTIFEVTDLIRGAAQLSTAILKTLDPKAFRDDVVAAVRGALYDVRRTLGQARIFADQFRRSGVIPKVVSAAQAASRFRPLTVGILPGVSLQSLAARHLGDSSRWVELAKANGLEHPFLDFSGPGGRPGAAYAGRRVFGQGDDLKLPLPASDSGAGIADDPVGTDISPDHPGVLVGGKDNLLARLSRRILTPRGRIPWHPGYGTGLRAMVGGSISESAAIRAQRDVREALQSDSMVLGVDDVSVESTQTGFLISANLQTALGPLLLSAPLSR